MSDLKALKKAVTVYKIIANINLFLLFFVGVGVIEKIIVHLPLQNLDALALAATFLGFWMNKNKQLESEQMLKIAEGLAESLNSRKREKNGESL